MNPHRPLPRSLLAQRVLLWAVAVVLLLNVVAALGEGDAFALGYSLPYALLAAICVVAALRLPRAERWVRAAIVAVHVLMLLGEIGRFAQGDPLAVIGLVFPVVGLVLILRASARRFFAA
ncbi:hypothetical protein CLV63_112157 [Murinocardiopsis flavida]|uniref:Uncharacterized protein n=1 Tax=Murinocardiopsis flavida TaxID=645275 RepID=A0A2P8DGC4_9ACTN|nr:hypothetical protein [Murinocardiopsis flavida]PSK96274.1 hypothetical protein CLV63_112157 [Murinocardiopsis flavida]